MALARVGPQTLDFVTGVRRPDSACLVTARGDDLVSLRVERDLTDFILVALQDGRARASEDVVDASHAICTRRRKLVARAVKASVEHFVVVPAELLDALSRANIPQARRPVNRPGHAIVTREIELAA